MGFFFFLGLGIQICKNLRNFWKFKKKKGPVSTIRSIMPIIWNFFPTIRLFWTKFGKIIVWINCHYSITKLKKNKHYVLPIAQITKARISKEKLGKIVVFSQKNNSHKRKKKKTKQKRKKKTKVSLSVICFWQKNSFLNKKIGNFFLFC